MGSFIELNDTLQITREQGFPTDLDIEKHMTKPFKATDFADKIFEFHDKEGIRIYHTPPVRVFLVENIDGKWLYWGHVLIVELNYDCVKKVTNGKYKITKIFTLEEMKSAHAILDGRDDFDFFKK